MKKVGIMKMWKLAVVIGFVAVLGIVGLVGCKDTPDTKTYTVTFNSDGGTAVDPQKVAENGKVTEPATPTKDNDVAGLYEGTPPDYTFDGWYNGTTKWEFDTSVTGNITLKAKWIAPVRITLDGDSDIFTQAITYTQANIITNGYTLLLDKDLETEFTGLSLEAGFNLTIIGIGEPRTITNKEKIVNFFSLTDGTVRLTIGKNIIINGIDKGSDTFYFCVINNGTLIMQANSKITGGFSSNAVRVGNSSSKSACFLMEGGEVTGNVGNDVLIRFSDSSSPPVFTLSGSAKIGNISLRTNGSSDNPTVTISSDWSGNSVGLNLEGESTLWTDKSVIRASEGYNLIQADITKFSLGNFVGITTQPISDTHKLELDTANNVIKLVAK